jgi:sugar lactone lactonase YvrE
MIRRMPAIALRALAFAAVLACGLAAPASAQILYWIDTSYGAPTLNRADDNGNALGSVALTAGTLPEGMALDATGKLYFGEAKWTGASIRRAAPTLASITPIVTGGSVIRGVAVDPVGQKLYWTTSNVATGATIGRSNLDGSGAVTLVSMGGAANPRGVAVDGAGGKIYWADFEQNTIQQANLDGSGAIVWQSLPPGSSPYGIAVNSSLQLVFWTEYGSGLLKRANTNGTGVTNLLAGLANPTYLALDSSSGRLYWCEGGFGLQRIRRATITGAAVTDLACPLTTYGGLAYQPNSQLSGPIPEPLPIEFTLDRPRPNPGRGPIDVRFALPRESRVRVSVLDVQGREVAVLADGVMPAGRHETTWGARPGDAAGVYFVRLAAAGRTWTQRVVRTR